jgi:hypothetical protein
VKGFKAHRLLDSKGYAKLGGHQRDGSVAIDRYISHRRGNGIVSLGVWLRKDASAENHEFHVIAPIGMLEDGKSFAEVRPDHAEKNLQPSHQILSFKDLPTAATVFDKALAKLTA